MPVNPILTAGSLPKNIGADMLQEEELIEFQNELLDRAVFLLLVSFDRTQMETSGQR